MPTLLADAAAAASLAEPASLAIASTRPLTTSKAPPTGILLLLLLVADEEAPPTGTVARGVSSVVEFLVRITDCEVGAEAAAPLVVVLVMPRIVVMCCDRYLYSLPVSCSRGQKQTIRTSQAPCPCPLPFGCFMLLGWRARDRGGGGPEIDRNPRATWIYPLVV